MANWIVEEFQRDSTDSNKVIEEIIRTGKRIFPEYKFKNWSFEDELRKSNSCLLYSIVNGDVAGYVLYMYSWPSSLSSFITEIAVKEDYRRQGLGEALLKAAIDKCRARNMDRITLNVDTQRIAAVNLYKKLGFKVEAFVEKLYSQKQDAYRMYFDWSMK